MPSAERVAWSKFKVVVVSLSALVILGTIAYLLTGGTLLESKATLYLYIPDATGLLAGSAVRVNGIGVGKVQSVGFSGSTSPDRIVKVALTVQRERLSTITLDSTAQLASETAVGDKYVAINSGTSPGHIQPGGEVPLKREEELLKTLDLEDFQKQVDAIDALIGDIEQGKGRVGEIVIGDTAYRNLLNRIAEVERAARVATDVSGAIGRELHTDELFQQIHEPLAKLDQSLARLQSGQGNAGRFLRDPAQYQGLRDDLAKLRSSIASLNSEPIFQSAQAYTLWNRQVASLIRTVDEFNANPMMATTAVYDTLNGTVKEMQRTMKEFRENPRRYLRLKLF